MYARDREQLQIKLSWRIRRMHISGPGQIHITTCIYIKKDCHFDINLPTCWSGPLSLLVKEGFGLHYSIISFSFSNNQDHNVLSAN